MREIRLVHCAETITGGIATYLRDLLPLQCESFGAENITVVIPESQRAELPVPEGVNVVGYSDSKPRSIRAIGLAWRVLKVARQSRATLVHVHSTFAGVAVRPLIRLAIPGIKLVYCAHGWAWDRMSSGFGRAGVRVVERALVKITDSVVCISNHEYRAAVAAGMDEAKLCVVRNAIAKQSPVAAGPVPEWPEGMRRVLFVGRFDRQKGVDVLIAALDHLVGQAHAVIAGSPVLADVSSHADGENVTRAGWVTPAQIEALFTKAEVLVVPSRWEGFGLIALEAMRAGLPVIASRVGGLPEVVKDGVTGVLVAPESPMELAEAILRLDQESCKTMGAAGRLRFEEVFSIERLHRELCAVYAGK